MYELKEIRERRKKLELTQSQLAKKADVSQSLIAKVEAGRLDPTYTKAMKIFRALEELAHKGEMKAEEIMTSKIVSVSPDSNAEEIIKKMRKYEISQIPVIEREKAVGLLSEASVLDALMVKKKEEIKAKDVMKDAPPTINKTAALTVISELLKFYPLVLVSDQGKIIGVITKSDVLRKVYK